MRLLEVTTFLMLPYGVPEQFVLDLLWNYFQQPSVWHLDIVQSAIAWQSSPMGVVLGCWLQIGLLKFIFNLVSYPKMRLTR